jgi:hypothetical protein
VKVEELPDNPNVEVRIEEVLKERVEERKIALTGIGMNGVGEEMVEGKCEEIGGELPY